MKTMKHVLVGALVLMVSSSVWAAAGVGVVDVDRVVSRYDVAVKMQEELKKRRDDFQKLFEEKNKKLEDVRKKAKKEDEIRAFITKTETELKPKQEEILRYEQEQNRKIAAKIFEVSEVVAKKYGVDTVVDKRAVLAGGYDMTDAVLAELNKTK